LTGQPVEEGQALDSANILPILLGEQPEGVPVRTELVLQAAAQWEAHRSYRGIRVGSWTLILDSDDRPVELYDLDRDLEQEANLIDDPQYATRVASMLSRYEYALHQSTRTQPAFVDLPRPTR
jgi:arylsulfatase A-like enzyme